jgi:signal transduction histidine kinase
LLALDSTVPTGAALWERLRFPELESALRRALAGEGAWHADASSPRDVGRTLALSVAPVGREGLTKGALDPRNASHREGVRLSTGARRERLDAGGPLLGAVALLSDVTAIRRLEQMRIDFVANVSHELRTPLAALTGFIETLQGPAHDDPAARERFLGIMQAQAWRMARLVDDLLSLSRIELRAHQRPETPVELVPIVRQVADGLLVLARERGVAVEVTEPEEPLTVLGDRDELIRLFENLIENGLKYGASGKRVAVMLGRTAGGDGKAEASVSVRDYGPGIAAEHLPRLTERFYRVDVGESRAQGGTGLGLALVKHILNRHQGRLSIASKEGEGATFTIRLPLAEPASGQNSARSSMS